MLEWMMMVIDARLGGMKVLMGAGWIGGRLNG